MKKTAVIAVGGNSLILDKHHQSVADQYKAVERTMGHVASMIEKGYEVVITHGNGPQVGFILLRSEIAKDKIHRVPLDSCGADTQGAIGYNFQMALDNEFRRRGVKKTVATVVTQVVVDKKDPAFQRPSKPIGPFYSKEDAEEGRAVEGWDIVEDAGRGWRRVVASPLPKEIVEFNAIKTLVDNGVVVIAVGGGGIPVTKDESGDLHGAAAVIDKDFASGLLAKKLGADLFIISTAVEGVALNFGTPEEKAVDKMTVADARQYMDEGHFKPGSMLPKIQAAIEFLESGGKEVLITDPDHLEDALDGKTGTRIVP